MNHDPSLEAEIASDERRGHVWAVIGSQVLHEHRPRSYRGSPWPQRQSDALHSLISEQTPDPLSAVGHPLDAAYEQLSSLEIDSDAADIDLMLEAVRAERLKQQVEQYQHALLELLSGPPESQERRKARGIARYGRDLFSELRADALSADELAALLPWPPTRP